MRQRLTAATLRTKKQVVAASTSEMEQSAHPGSPNFDQQYALGVIGKLAEEVRQYLADKYDASPPGLQTINNGDGTLTVKADNPEAGIGIQIDISLMGGEMAPESPQEPPMGVGPPPAQSMQPIPGQPPPMQQPPPQMPMGVGPPPTQ